MYPHMTYQFRKEDAIGFAESLGIQYKVANGNLHFLYCPYCKGGKNRDKNTFAISLSTGQFHCNRESCLRDGNMFTLSQDFDYRLPGVSDRYYTTPKKQYRKFKTPEKPIEPKAPAIAYLESRGISAEVAKKYEITTWTNRDNVLVFPFYDSDEKLVFIKYRKTDFNPEKDSSKEWAEKDGRPILFGMKQCNLENKTLIITEGQLDSLSIAEAGIENAVSVPTGARGFTWVPNCWDWVNLFETLIVFGDHEKGHITLLDDLKARFKIKIKVVREEDYKDCKDANDILRKYGKEQILQCISNAEEILLPHVRRLADVGYLNIFDVPKLPTGINCLDRLLYGGIPFGGVTLLASKPGSGKSTFASQVVINAIQNGYKVFAYSGELPNELFRAWMDMQVAGASHIFEYRTKWGDTGYNISQANRNCISEWYGDKIFIYDSRGIDDENESLLRLTEDMILRNGVNMVLIDNLMTALDLEMIMESDKYERQSKFVKGLTRIALQYNVIILLVAHKRKNNFSTVETDEISGSGDIGNLGMVVISYDKDDNLPQEDRLLKVGKNRLFGKTNTNGWVVHYEECSKRIYSTEVERKIEYGWTNSQNSIQYSIQERFSTVTEAELEEIPF